MCFPRGADVAGRAEERAERDSYWRTPAESCRANLFSSSRGISGVRRTSSENDERLPFSLCERARAVTAEELDLRVFTTGG